MHTLPGFIIHDTDADSVLGFYFCSTDLSVQFKCRIIFHNGFERLVIIQWLLTAVMADFNKAFLVDSFVADYRRLNITDDIKTDCISLVVNLYAAFSVIPKAIKMPVIEKTMFKFAAELCDF